MSNDNILMSGVVQDEAMTLERTGYMKTLAEEQIKNGQTQNGITTAKEAIALLKQCMNDHGSFQILEMNQLLAEAFTVNNQALEAITTYQEILDATSQQFNANKEQTKNIYRQMAPLHSQLGNYTEAAACLKKAFEAEE